MENKNKKIEGLDIGDINFIERLLNDALKNAISVSDLSSIRDRAMIATKFDLHMIVLKQSTMHGCRVDYNPYRDN